MFLKLLTQQQYYYHRLLRRTLVRSVILFSIIKSNVQGSFSPLF